MGGRLFVWLVFVMMSSPCTAGLYDGFFLRFVCWRLFVNCWYAQAEIGCSLGPWLCWRAERRNTNRPSV